MLKIPVSGAEIQEVSGVQYLVVRLDRNSTCSDFISELRSGRPVVVPFSKRGHLTGLLKKEGIYTRQKTVIAGQWTTFLPCEKREFKL